MDKFYEALVCLFGSFLISLDITDFGKEDFDLVIFKICAEANCLIPDNSLYSFSWRTLIKIIVHSKKFSFLVLNKEIKNYSENLNNLNLLEHLTLISFLIDTTFEFKIMKDYIKGEIDKLNELSKEKVLLELEM